MLKKLYTFVGCAAALRYYVTHSSAPDKAAALAACDQLTSVSDALLDAAGNNTTEAQFKELCGQHVITVLEAIETLRGTSINATLNENLLSLLEHYYAAADALAGGGGRTVHGSYYFTNVWD